MGKKVTGNEVAIANNNVIKDTEENQEKDESCMKFVEGKDGLIVPDPENNPQVLEAVEWIREQMNMEYAQNPDPYIECDIKMLNEHDYFIRRFLYPHDLDPVPAFDQLKTNLAWRKEVGFDGASDERFPLEFYKIGALFPYLPDREGTNMLYMRFKVYKKLDILDKAIKQFLVYNMYKLDVLGCRERSWAVVFDTRNAGWAQVDFDMLIFLFKTVKQHFPWGLKYVAIYELPWILQGGWKITQRLLPQDATRLFKFVSKDTITELIAPEHLPDFMDGTCEKDYREVPEGCEVAEIIAAKEMGLTPEEVAKVKKHFEKHFEEANNNCKK